MLEHCKVFRKRKHRNKIDLKEKESVLVACIKATSANTVARDSPVHCVPNSTQVPSTLSKQNKRQRKKSQVSQKITPQLFCSQHVGILGPVHRIMSSQWCQ